MKQNLIELNDNPDITKERKNATFAINELANFIHGGEEIVQKRKSILRFVESRPEFQDSVPLEFLNREERYEAQARKAVLMTTLATEVINPLDFFGEGMYYQSLIIGRDLHAMSLHYLMFLPTLQGQGTEEQIQNWFELSVSRGILGTYAQTELGHGTNLNRLETTATYDSNTEEFIINSPTISSTKWWPGSLGKSSNYAIVMAQLITKNVCHGPHPFVVQLRDLNTHEPLKSLNFFIAIEVGDIGPKLGINGSDNGYLLFKNHRIPRTNMLMRYSKVLSDGTYIKPKHNKLSYGSMVFVRSIMIRDQAMQLGAAATIATRYSAVRRQGELKPNGEEVQVLDYQTQQYRILPHVASTIVFLLAAEKIKNLYVELTKQLASGSVNLLAEVHAISSGLKSVVSWEVAKGIEQCRLACGGHGYSQASAFPEIYAYAVGGCTYEGENIVMLLQAARQLMKAAKSIRSNCANLFDIESYLKKEILHSTDFSNFNDANTILPKHLIQCYENAARHQVFYTLDLLIKLQKEMTSENAWNSASVELCRASRLHVKAYLVKNFFSIVESTQLPSTVGQLLLDLGKIFALYQILQSSLSFSKFLTTKQLLNMQNSMYELLKKLRLNAVAIVDSFDFSDRELNSVLGRRDGNVYAALLKWAQQSPFNKKEVSSAYDKYLKPMMIEGRSKL